MIDSLLIGAASDPTSVMAEFPTFSGWHIFQVGHKLAVATFDNPKNRPELCLLDG